MRTRSHAALTNQAARSPRSSLKLAPSSGGARLDEPAESELLAFHRAVMDVYGQEWVDPVLETIADRAANLVDGRFGAVSVADGAAELSRFITVGAPAGVRRRLPPPCGRGLIAAVRDGGERIRLDDLGSDSRHCGFPPGHPAMRSLVAVPIRCRGPFRGGLFVAEKIGAGGFSERDEETLGRFADAVAAAMDHAHLRERLRAVAALEERKRIGREIHDGVAQVLAYVNAKAQAVDLLLERGDVARARDQLRQLTRAAQDASVDAREAIMDLRTDVFPDQPLPDKLRDCVLRWETLAGVKARVEVDPDARCAAGVTLQLLCIVQEALANVRKHARADSVHVQLRREGSRVLVTVHDDGAGFELSSNGTPRFGLSIMRERAESVGGTLRVTAGPDAGTTVSVDMPGFAPEG